MRQDKETRKKLLESAKTEFLEKGYMKASLRNICKNAGVTTGALYFFFQDKADLFEALTKEPLEQIFSIMMAHYTEEYDIAERDTLLQMSEMQKESHYMDANEAIHMMYEHRDALLLVLTKSQGSTMEGILDRFIDVSEKHFEHMARQMEAVYPGKKIDNRFVHWLAHEQIGTFVYMITHIEDETEGREYMNQTISFMIAGWLGLFQ
ncbi:MAG: TetR/AcrR family transcriptional regulator [Eubacterium sp.]|nr:TetR/AcrR family transcriptional regulator [Eubacterium sp.]